MNTVTPAKMRPGERHVQAKSRFDYSWPVLAAAAAGLVLSFVLACAVGRWDSWTNKIEFEGVAKNQTIILQSGIKEYLLRLLALRTLFESANDRITRSEFEVFSSQLFEEHPGILRVNWVPRVTRKERVEFER